MEKLLIIREQRKLHVIFARAYKQYVEDYGVPINPIIMGLMFMKREHAIDLVSNLHKYGEKIDELLQSAPVICNMN